MVTVDGHDYEIMKGATYEDSRKVDDLLDSHGDKPISAFRKQPQGMSLKQAAMELVKRPLAFRQERRCR